VFASIRELFGIERDDRLQLRDYPTLSHVIGFVRDRAEQPEAAPVAASAATVAAVVEAAPVAASADAVEEQVLAMVSEVTGYPSDMLDLDLDLEADLGIDTVKQAEVFASIRELFGIERDDRLQLRDYPTLSHVIGFVRDRAEQPEAAPSPDTTEQRPHIAIAPPEGSIQAADEIPRRVPVPELRPELDDCVPTAVELGAGSRVVVVCDEGGVGAALGGLLEARGVDVLSIEDPTDAETLVSTLEGWRGDGEVDGVYWLPALDVEPPLTELDLDTWRVATEIRVKLLHATMRLLYADIDGPERFLIGGTRLGGLHGYGSAGATAPMGGAVTGFVKAFKRERPDALVKAVDVAVEAEPARVARQLVDEARHDPGCVEVGYHDDQRWTVGLRQKPAADGGSGMELGSETVFVITGAAGSIVSAITADLARHSGGTFHLLDLTPEPDPADQDVRQFGEDREALKRAIFNRIKESGERATPARVEEELARLERLDAARGAIEAVEDAGGVARYHSVDLTDGEAVRTVIERVREDHGRIDVLIHAAGLDISRFVPDKEPAEFALVFDVKCEGWINLMSAAGDLPIGATVVFSSVAGRFGNGGQVDYSAANDLLCKFSSSLRTTRPETRAIAIDWTAWADIGMATRGSIPKMMAMAGIEMLPAKAGIATVRRELTAGGTCGEVVIGGALGILTEDVHPTGGLDPSSIDVSGVGPMVGRVTGMGVYSGLTVETTLDPRTQNFLDDHRIDGIPVLPGVMGVEAFAEVARLLHPDLHVAGVEDVAFRAPLKFYGEEPRDILISAHFRRDAEDLVVDCELIGRRVLANQAEPQVTTHFTATVRLSDAPPPRPEGDKPPAVEGVILEADPVYEVYFHGPAYQVLERAWKTADGSAGLFSEDLPANHTPAQAPLTMAPRLIELCFQTAGVWEIGHEGRMALPTGIGRVSTYGDPSTATGRLFAVASRSGDSLFDCRVVDESGTVFVVMDNYRTIALPSPLADDGVAPFREAMS
jgi:NAD(P)-dependent dehydrogenase (short-subunit alcohol dehydrogenase family)/acyl carrier protein